MSHKNPVSPDDRPAFVRPAYSYRAEVVEVIDGDTIDVDIDVGFNITVRKRLRFLLVDTWETRGEERERGLAAKEFCSGVLSCADAVYVQTVMDAEGKYGRLLAWVWVQDDDTLHCLNVMLLDEGHGEVYK